MPELVKGGGHELAAGFSIEIDKIGEFRQALIAHAGTLEGFEPGHLPIEVTAEVRAEEVTLEAVQEMEILEPFGMGNPSPVFLTRKMRVEEKRVIGRDGTHVSLVLRSLAGSQRQINAWSMAESLTSVSVGQFIDVVYNPVQDTFNGMTKLKWNLRDWVHSA
jgi:single-stranded-DNA-specific exonuclease